MTLFPEICQSYEHKGYLKIETSRTGIEIHLDQERLGFTPLPVLELEPGNYELTALHPNRYVWGNLDWQQRIQITPDDTLIIKPDFSKILSLRSSPFGADVFVNSQFLGKTPLNLIVSNHENGIVKLKKEGFLDYSISLDEITTNFLNIALIEKKSDFNLITVDWNHQRDIKKRYRRLTYGLWGLSILTGLTTVYFKDQADQKYEQYLRAGSLQDMNKYFQDSKNYDKYANISAGVLQGCFLLSFYFLFKSIK